MPWYHYRDSPDRYEAPTDGVVLSSNGIDAIVAMKKVYSRDRDYFLACQRACGREDRDLARYFREEAARCLRSYRACCYVLSQIMSDPPGDSRDVVATRELADDIDRTFLVGHYAS